MQSYLERDFNIPSAAQVTQSAVVYKYLLDILLYIIVYYIVYRTKVCEFSRVN